MKVSTDNRLVLDASNIALKSILLDFPHTSSDRFIISEYFAVVNPVFMSSPSQSHVENWEHQQSLSAEQLAAEWVAAYPVHKDKIAKIYIYS